MAPLLRRPANRKHEITGDLQAPPSDREFDFGLPTPAGAAPFSIPELGRIEISYASLRGKDMVQ